MVAIRGQSVQPVNECWRSLTTTSSAAFLNQGVSKKLRWFGHAACRPGREQIRGFLMFILPCAWQTRVGSHLKTWAATLKADLELLSGLFLNKYKGKKAFWKSLVGLHWPLGASSHDLVTSTYLVPQECYLKQVKYYYYCLLGTGWLRITCAFAPQFWKNVKTLTLCGIWIHIQ